MNKYQTYSLIGKILALDFFPAQRDPIIRLLQKRDMKWEQFIATADYHMVLQSLYPQILRHHLEEFFPAEVTEHLKTIFELSEARNLQITDQSARINSLLRQKSIIPLFMKGMGNIFDGLYTNPGQRILHDIDILVPEEDFEEAAEVLISYGYIARSPYIPREKNPPKHYPILCKDGEPAYLELHRMPVSYKYSGIVNTKMVFGDARQARKSPEFTVMSDEHKILHNFIHAQLDHKGRMYARDFIRNLHDLLLISGYKEPETVLTKTAKYRRAASGYLDIYYDTFGIAPVKRSLPAFFIHSYRTRYYLNLRFRLVGMASFYITRWFLGFVVKPINALSDRKFRRSLLIKMRDKNWYRKQGTYFSKVIGTKGKSGKGTN